MTSEGSSPDLGALFAQLGQLQQGLHDARQELAERTVEGTAGGGKVVVCLHGDFRAESVRIDPSVVDASDTSLVEDLVLAALRHAFDQVVALQEETMARAAPLGGIPGLGGLPGMPGL